MHYSLLLTGCSTNPLAQIIHAPEAGSQLQEIRLPDLSTFGINTEEFTRNEKSDSITYGYDKIAYEGDPPARTYITYCNPEGDRLQFDQYGRLAAYDAHEQTVRHWEEPVSTDLAAMDEALNTTDMNGQTAAVPAGTAAPFGSSCADESFETENGTVYTLKSAYIAAVSLDSD